jgi:anhydro-N-acetylmuramic acid kinase
MLKNEYKVVGVMSGTSLDGIDLAYVTFKFDRVWDFKIEIAETLDYDSYWLNILHNLTSFSSERLLKIDFDYSIYLAHKIRDFLKKNSIEFVDAVCSHGHTALHEPEKGLTYQIGNRASVSKELNITVICDFRVQDVKLGGQGAPLVPIGDQLLFADYDYCLNLGGFANISTEKNGKRIAYDICAVNTVLNHYSGLLGYKYDDKGKIASKGFMNEKLFKQLNSLEFFSQTFPKSLGIEWVKKEIFPLIDNYHINPQDVLRTFAEHIAFQVSKGIIENQKSSVLVTGGGAYNFFLIERIKSMTNKKIVIPDNLIINYKEAMIFGLLGVLKLRNEVNCLSSVTGAKIDHSSGMIFRP